MKGLRKYIYPFAPDQSGATSVLYDLGGILVICDAGGCAGNICGFDEPRWFESKSAIFSAGLRDMDAILGRDDLLVEKLKSAAQKLDADFAAVIGTPVPATIATDYHAIKKMAQKRVGLPVLTVETNGIRLYDEGASEAYVELFSVFAEDTQERNDTVGVLGALPLDLGDKAELVHIQEALHAEGMKELICYGAGCSLEDVKAAGKAKQNIVLSPAGLAAAKYLKKRFGTPYTCRCPYISGDWKDAKLGERALIIHQQFKANALREELRKHTDAQIDVASWFMMEPSLKEEGDFRLKEEDQFVELLESGRYDTVIADPSLKRAVDHYGGRFYELAHFAISG